SKLSTGDRSAPARPASRDGHLRLSRQECRWIFLRTHRDWHVGGNDGGSAGGESARGNEVRLRSLDRGAQGFAGKYRRLHSPAGLHCLRFRNRQPDREGGLSGCAVGPHHRSCGESEIVSTHVAESVALGANDPLFTPLGPLGKRASLRDPLRPAWVPRCGIPGTLENGRNPPGNSATKPPDRGLACRLDSSSRSGDTARAVALSATGFARLCGMVCQLFEAPLCVAGQPFRIEGNANCPSPVIFEPKLADLLSTFENLFSCSVGGWIAGFRHRSGWVYRQQHS